MNIPPRPARAHFVRGFLFSRLLLCGLLMPAVRSRAQTRDERHLDGGGEGPTHLVLTYKCTPEKRAAFRSYMETAGVAQFEQWKQAGVVSGYLVLFSSFVNEQLADMWIVLDFERFVDVSKWQEVERSYPGGLAKEGLTLATPRTCVYTDLNWRAGQED